MPLIAAATVALALLAIACSPRPAAPAATPAESVTTTQPAAAPTAITTEDASSVFRYAIAEPSAIVPPLADGPDEVAVVDALFDSLTAWDDDGEVVPAAARSWRASSDLTTWIFHLRATATYHDGQAVTADDVKFAWETTVRLGQVGHHLRDVVGHADLIAGTAPGLTGVTALSPITLQVQLARPVATFPAVAAHPALAPFPQAAWLADEAGFRERPIGNGPFQMAGAWAHDRFIRVQPFPAWANAPTPGGSPALDEVLFEITDPDSAYVGFQQGRVDFTVLPVGALASAVDRFGVAGPDRDAGVLTGAQPVLYHLAFNVTAPPFDDPEVRRAISLAIDREALVAATPDANLAVADGAVPPGIPGRREGACESCRHAPGAAAAIFAERGITQLTFAYSREGGHDRVAQQVRDDLDAAGVRVTFHTEDFGAYLASLQAGGHAWYRFGWAADQLTMGAVLEPLFAATADPIADASANYGRYANPDVDALLDRAAATADERVRQRLYRQAEDVALNTDQAIVPLFTYGHRAIAAARVQGLRYSPLGLVNLTEITVRTS